MLPNCVVNLSTAFGQLVNPKRVRKDKLLKQKVQMRTGDLICRSIKSSIIQKVIRNAEIFKDMSHFESHSYTRDCAICAGDTGLCLARCYCTTKIPK